MLTRILQMFPDWVMMLVYLMAGFLVIIHMLRKLRVSSWPTSLTLLRFQYSSKKKHSSVGVPEIVGTVRPRNTQPQAARTLQVHVFELGPKIFKMHVFARFCTFLHDFARFCTFFHKWVLEMHVFARFYTVLQVFCTYFSTWVLEIHDTPIKYH